jgi:purine-cytosine permease-like protein
MHYAAVTTGALGPVVWELGWWDSFLIAVFFNLLGCIFVGLISTIGPQTGMRTMVITRYSFGYWANKLIVVLTGITCLGWMTINTVAGGGLLYDAWDNKVPLVVVIIIIMAG